MTTVIETIVGKTTRNELAAPETAPITAPYEKVSAARAQDRFTSLDLINSIFRGFVEMHGDRCYGDDKAVVAGIAYLADTPITVIGIEKGHTIRERTMRNFGSAHPEGYRKALRQMKLAEKFGRPVICFVDTSGAYCGIGAEERGQGQAIAENLMEMMTLKVPVISVILGEGGSGGALALAVADEVWMLENSIYSVISPEGCASILWRDHTKAREASVCLKLTAEDLLKLKIIDRIILEGATMIEELQSQLMATVEAYRVLTPDDLTERRYQRFRNNG
ncbi:MAG: acetyl-CoA carboxylase carboxyl transferase subunit alpha [Peptococcaceae bacterium]|nr:acetyl-CoA carboxylase carboxyl transferase subunit alpha [Peptococcaceae bacterium]